MVLAKSISELNTFFSAAGGRGSRGLVPTMGALHGGHLSLVECSCSENDLTVVTVFVNPAQFNDPEDLKKYPRNLERDLRMLEQTGCDLVFAPDEKTIYPEPDNRVFDFGKTGNIMEGFFRPGHFNGVALVVSRLFEIIKPGKAYFGEKDLQQVAIIRRMTEMLGLPVGIRSCPTLRESDGLAMSSRNVLLDTDQRKSAPLIYQTLQQATEKTGMQVDELKRWVTDRINQNPLLEVEYFEIVDKDSLLPVEQNAEIGGGMAGCIAVRTGQIRLIDNEFFSNFASL